MLKTKNLEKSRLNFETLKIHNKKLKDAFNRQCLSKNHIIDVMETLIDKNTWDEFAHDQCPAPNEIKNRFCKTPYFFYEGHLSFFSFPEDIFKCMQKLLQFPVWPFYLSIKRKQPFNPILQIDINYFFATKNK